MKLNLKDRTGYISLNSEHSILTGNKPLVISSDMFTETRAKTAINRDRENIERFGLFDSSTPNYTTYYPDLNPEDLSPKDEEFIYPIFRMLSATTLWKGFRPIDFSEGNVLKKSQKLLIGQTINADHETALGNAMGAVKSTFWEESYTVDGIIVPAGINGEFKIDGKANPRIARGIMMDPPSIHSNSVSVRFAWEPSHKLKSDEDFFSKLGTKDPEGNLYRLVVSEIMQYSETSLVGHGADAFAQIIRNGKINNPVYASKQYSFSAKDDEGKELKVSHVIDYKTDLTLSADNDTILNTLNNNNNFNNNEEGMEQLLELLENHLGLEKASLTKDNVGEAITGFVENKVTLSKSEISNELNQVKEELQTKTEEVTTLNETITSLKGKETLALKYEEALNAKRTEAKRLYTFLKGDNQEASIISLLDSCDETALETLSKGYEQEIGLKFPDTCKDCNGTNINKASSFNDNGNQGDDDNKIDSTTLSGQKLRDHLRTEARK